MSKIKVPMRIQTSRRITGPFGSYLLDIRLIPDNFTGSYDLANDTTVPESEYIKYAFNEYMKKFQSVDMQTLYAIHSILKSARVDNAFDMLTLTKQLLPMLDEVIAQADPDNYELEIIK